MNYDTAKAISDSLDTHVRMTELGFEASRQDGGMLGRTIKVAEDTVALMRSRTPVYHWFRPEHTKEAFMSTVLKEMRNADLVSANRLLGYLQGIAAAMYAIKLEELEKLNAGL